MAPSATARLAVLGASLGVILMAAGCATSALVDDPLVASVYDAIGAGDVTVRNDDGVITLGGFIEGVGSEQAYIDAVSGVPGVTRVESDLIVRGDDG